MNKKISIILCSYNEVHYIEECISLINKTLKNVEIIKPTNISFDVSCDIKNSYLYLIISQDNVY